MLGRKSGQVKLKLAFLSLLILSGGFLYFRFTPQYGFSKMASEVPAFSSWAIDQAAGGVSLPRFGRSLFDKICLTEENGKLVYRVPFPFTELIKKIDSFMVAEPDGRFMPGGFQGVLFPVGRSLQRDVNAPDFFKSPRISSFMYGQPNPSNGNLLLKDRLYIGYQPKAEVMEVISYNETMGRFEFQVVHDYKAGAQPKLFYADRALCVSCHQGQSPIFSKPPWQESNANPSIFNKLSQDMGGAQYFQGVPLKITPDVPQQLQAASDRANLFSYYQKQWSEGCDSTDCLKNALMLILQYKLAGDQFNDQWPGYAAYKTSMLKTWNSRWPQGIAIPLSLIESRDPLDARYARDFSVGNLQIDPRVKGELTNKIPSLSQTSGANVIPAYYEPIVPRPPLEVLNVYDNDVSEINNMIPGLGSFITDQEVQNIDAKLFQTATSQGTLTSYLASCRFQKKPAADGFQINVSCQPDPDKPQPNTFSMSFMTFKVVGGKIMSGGTERLITKREPDQCHTEFQKVPGPFCGFMSDFQLQGTYSESNGVSVATLYPTKVTSLNLHARISSGEAIQQIQLTWKQGEDAMTDGTGKITTVDDISVLKNAVNSLQVLAVGRAFQRTNILTALSAQLGFSFKKYFDEDTMPAGQLPPIEVNHEGETPATKVVGSICIRCHNGMLGLKLNFLGLDKKVDDKVINGCAQRMSLRLHSWQLVKEDRVKNGMPPDQMLTQFGMTPTTWINSTDYKNLLSYVDDLVGKQNMTYEKVYQTVKENNANYNSLPTCWP